MDELNEKDSSVQGKLRNIYSIHLDKVRILLVCTVIFVIVAGTFFIGLYVGGSENQVYDNYSLGVYPGKKAKAGPGTENLVKDMELPQDKKGYDLLNDEHVSLSNKEDEQLLERGEKIHHNSLSRKYQSGESNLYVSDKNKIRPLDSENSLDMEIKEFKTLKTKKIQRNNDSHPGKVAKRQKRGNAKKNPSHAISKKEGKTYILPTSSAVDQPDDENENQGAKFKLEGKKRNSLKKNNGALDKIMAKYPVKKGYQIQVASFQKVYQAKKIKDKLNKIGIQGNISAKVGKNGILYRVSYGAGKSINQLEKELIKLRQHNEFLNSFIIKM